MRARWIAGQRATLAIDGKAIKVGLSFNTGSEPGSDRLRPGHAGVGHCGIVGLSNLVDVEGKGKLNVGANATVNFDIGVDLTDPLSPKPFLYDSTGISLTRRATGTNLEFTAAAGPLGLFIKGGTGEPRQGRQSEHDGLGGVQRQAEGYAVEPVLLRPRRAIRRRGPPVNVGLTGRANASLPLFPDVSSRWAR